MPRIRSRFATIGVSRRAPCAAIETWSSWLALVGVESVEQGMARCLFSLISAAVVTSAIMKPEFSPGSGVEERRQVEGERRIDHQRHPALRDRADLGDRQRDDVGGEGHRLGVEVAARDDRRPSSTSGLSVAALASISSVAAAWRSRSIAAPVTCGWQRMQ